MRRKLLAWYRRRKRDLPFRRTRDPYAILVAEVLLQRTRVKAGVPFYERFLEAFPTVSDLAVAKEADVLRAWEGLGFYRRARNLHRAAKMIVERYKSQVPSDFEDLRSLPGVGDYTAGAVGSIAFGLRVPAVDGNAARVLARMHRIEDDLSQGVGKRRILALATGYVPRSSPGEWNQALMELGATTCLPKAPRCGSCPVSSECVAFAAGVQHELPRAPAKREVPVVPVVFVVARRGDSVLLARRAHGLHEGLYALPGGRRDAHESEEAAARRYLRSVGVDAPSLAVLAPVRHAFSHLLWRGTAFVGEAEGDPTGAEWIPEDRLLEIPVVPLHRRLLSRARA
jgi:A/G-specific adenine glycosylase